MAIRNMSKRVRADGASRGRLFREPSSIGRVLLFGAISAIAFAYGFATLFRGDTRLGIFFLAVMFGLYAFDNFRRLPPDE